MNKDISDLDTKLSRLQLRRKQIVNELEAIEQQISQTIDKKKKAATPPEPKVVDTRNIPKDKSATAIDHTGHFIAKGDRVRVLTEGMYKGEVVTVIEVNDNKASIRRANDNTRPSWRLSHNLLKIETVKNKHIRKYTSDNNRDSGTTNNRGDGHPRRKANTKHGDY